MWLRPNKNQVGKLHGQKIIDEIWVCCSHALEVFCEKQSHWEVIWTKDQG
jgi:hypothetical protein